MRRHRPGAAPDSPLAAVAAEAVRGDGRGVGRRRSRPIALDATWRLIRETNAYLEANEPWKAEPGPEVDAVMGDALEALRIVAVLAVAGDARHAAPRSGDRIGLPARRPSSACPRRAAWGGYPGGLPVEKGDAALPASPELSRGAVVRWTDSHCHLADDRRPDGADAAVAAARAAGVARFVCVGTDAARSAARPSPSPRAHDDVWATVGLHPHDAGQGVDALVELLDRRPGRGRRGVRARLPLRPLAARRPAGRLRRPDRAWPTSATCALVIHTREAWDDTFAILAAEGVPDATVFHCFTGGPEEARRASTSGPTSPSAAS